MSAESAFNPMLEARGTGRRRVVLLGVCIAGLAAVTLADGVIFRALRVEDGEALARRDWYQFLRLAGYLPVWVLAGAAVLGHDVRARRVAPARRGVLLALAPLLAGAGAELLKIVLPRQRPIHNGVADGVYVWGTPFEALHGVGNHGLASSHAAVAFGGAFMASRLFPGSGPWLLLAALGCGVSRLLTGAHFASDVFVGMALGYAAAAALARRCA